MSLADDLFLEVWKAAARRGELVPHVGNWGKSHFTGDWSLAWNDCATLARAIEDFKQNRLAAECDRIESEQL